LCLTICSEVASFSISSSKSSIVDAPNLVEATPRPV
jgi:hypothetical protein